ncbi:hypothetical protein PybrP1_006197 [[Pythium] brassicae (nom. inval.)]|nr:hypothetical protein PybrP1_006197 [[Pythium] brassicae (nom. inval.)]
MAQHSPNLMEFDDDSPRVAPPASLAVSGVPSGPSGGYFSDLRPPPPAPAPVQVAAPEPLPLLSPQPAAPEPERLALSFFVSCTGVDGALAAGSSSARTAQTFVRGALSMLAQSTGGKAKAPPAADVNVEVRVSRELPAHREHAGESDTAEGSALGSESYWSERRRSRDPHFAVGFTVQCQALAAFDRHVQIMVMVPDEGQASNKNSQLFGYAQTTFHEMYAVAASGGCRQQLTLPVHSTLLDGATVVLSFADVRPLPHALFAAHHNAFRTFRFAPPTGDGAPTLAVEEAAEVDFSVTIPLQLMTVCHLELSQMYEDWKARYNYNRKKSRHFADDAEALSFGHDVYRVQVICGRNLSAGSGGSGAGALDGVSTGRSSTFSLAGRGGIMNRLKTQAGKWGGPGGGGASGDLSGDSGGAVNPFVVVKYSEGSSGPPHELAVGRTNTEYDTGNPVWSSNKHAAKCPHGKPTTKMFVSASLPSRVEVSPVNTLKQFLFYRPSALQSGTGELTGWLRFEVFNESYAYMTGVEHELLGEVTIPLQSVRDAMAVEQHVVAEAEADSVGAEEPLVSSPHETRRPTVSSLTLVDWFDVRSPTTDEVFGQLQLRLNILLANPVASDPQPLPPSVVVDDLLLGADDDDALLAPELRTQRLAAECQPPPSPPPTSNVLEREMPLEFLHPHVLTLRRHLAEVAGMIRVSERLLAQRQTFKSSQDKKRADVQSLPTNLHVSYFRIYRNVASSSSDMSSSALPSSSVATVPVHHPQASTEDLLDLGFSNANADANELPAAGASSEAPALERPETHTTVTCGAPTAHAMGLSESGLREMELEIHRLQGLLDKCTPRVRLTTGGGDAASFVAEDAASDAVFASIADELEGDEGDSGDAGDAGDTDALVESATQSAKPPPSPKKAAAAGAATKYSTMAARAVAGAKAAKKRLPAPKKAAKPKDHAAPQQLLTATTTTATENDGGSSAKTGDATTSKYPVLRTEAEADDGADPTASVNYAVRVLCRLEMLRTEYYLRKSVAVAQAVSGLVACFVAELELRLAARDDAALAQLATVGFLVGWESLISSHGKELRMLSDAWVAIKCLETFAFELVEGESASLESASGGSQEDLSRSRSLNRSGSGAAVVLEKREHVGYTIRVAVPPAQFARLPAALQRGGLVAVTSVLFTQGINEMQSLANMVGHAGVSIQNKINSTSFRALVAYANRLSASSRESGQDGQGGSSGPPAPAADESLRHLRVSVEGESSSAKNTCILLHASDAVRSLRGGRLTFCKSGKDRTAMSVTLEQARRLVQRQRHVLEAIEAGGGAGAPTTAAAGPLDEVQSVANVLRAFGVRMAIAHKNVGRFQYSFNALQRKLLPEIYRPPVATIQDMVTSVTARDS